MGKDQFSHLAADHLTRSEIHSYTLYQSESEPTGNAIIYVSQENGENMIAIYSGANTTITHNEIEAIIPELSASDVLLVQLENNFDATHSLIKKPENSVRQSFSIRRHTRRKLSKAFLISM